MPLADRGIPRREFLKSAVAIGGSAALAACVNRESDLTTDTPVPETEGGSYPSGSANLDALPERQFAWNDYLVRDGHGNTILPQHQVILFLNYVGDGTPSQAERSQVESAFRTIERAFQRGTGGDLSAIINKGLLFTVGYSFSYFDRFESSLPSDVGLVSSATVIERVDGDPANAESYDAAVVLNADYASIALAAEEALLGKLDTVNGVEIEDSLAGVFERVERRSGFVGKGLPAQKIDDERIPETAPQSMGYKSGFKDNQATEDRVAIGSGPFAGGTTQMISRLEIDVDSWYDKDESTRVHRMFSPEHTPQGVGEVGEELASNSNITEETAEATENHAEQYGSVGHTQKTARARDDEFEPRILRRSESNATDVAKEGTAALNFTSVQRRMEDFVETRVAMNGGDLDVDNPHNGILDMLSVVSRATYLIPPRRHRALPTPHPQ